MWVDYRGPLSTVYNDGKISTCGQIIEVHLFERENPLFKIDHKLANQNVGIYICTYIRTYVFTYIGKLLRGQM